MQKPLSLLFAFLTQSADTYRRRKKDNEKKIVRVSILALFLASALIVTISTRTEAIHISPLSLSTSCDTGNTFFGDKVYARAKITYMHPTVIDNIIGAHIHGFSYSAWASVGYKVDQIPSGGGTAYKSIVSTTRFYSPQTITAYVTSGDHELSDAYASASASEDSDNSDYCPR